MSSNSPTRTTRRGARRVPRTPVCRYEVIRRIGVGGTADVSLAEDTQLGREVALKILHPQYAHDAPFLERFRREAMSAAKLQHPNIVQIYDSGTDGDSNFIVMEYVEGRSLRDHLAEEGPLEVSEAVRIASEVLKALTVAHRSGLVHRDIKPGNILMSEGGKVQVTDFGIAWADAWSTMTQTGTILGTASYLSPEQAQGLPFDGRSDIYSLGVLLYEMLTGRRPFEGDSPVSIAYQHVSELPRPPSHYRQDIPRPLEAIVLNALAKRPEDRYSSAALMRRDLEAFTQGRKLTANLKISAPEDSTQVIQTVGVLRRLAVRRPGWLIALATALLAGGLAIGTSSLVSLVSTVAGRVEVPKVVRRVPEDANRLLRQAGLDPSFQENEFSTTVAAGLVTRQEPSSGRSVMRESIVKYWVSIGRPTVDVPNVVGLSLQEAADRLSTAGLSVGRRIGAFSKEKAGIVLEQNPGAGSRLRGGDSVDLTVSEGEDKAIAPGADGNNEEPDGVEIDRNPGSRLDGTRERSVFSVAGPSEPQSPNTDCTFVVSRSVSTDAQSVDFETEGDASFVDADQTLEFAVGEASKNVVVDVTGKNNHKTTITVTLSDPEPEGTTGASSASCTVKRR